jgi:hypothetical protein
MTVATNVLTATVGDVELDVKAGSAALDEGWVPYVKVQLTIALPDVPTQDLLDPRIDPRITLTVARSVLSGTAFAASTARTFDVLVRERTIDHNDDTMQLDCGSDEYLLQDARLVDVVPDTSMLQHQASVRAICTATLASIGATLEAGDTDADATTTTSLTNLVSDPRTQSTSSFTASNGSAVLTAAGVTSAEANPSGYLLRAQWSASTGAPGIWFCGTNAAGGKDSIPLDAGGDDGHTLFVRATVYVSSAGTYRFVVNQYDATGRQTGSTAIAVTAVAATVYTVMTGTLVLRSDTVSIAVGVNTTATMPAGFTMSLSSPNVCVSPFGAFDTDGVTPLDYWDGDDPDDTYYSYGWDAGADASTSTRTPLVDRSPDALTRQPGQSWWDMLSAVLQTAGLRLFCDEGRVWRLVDSTYSVDGRVTVAAGSNAYSAQDTIGRDQTADDGTPLWFDACVIKYTWTDSTGKQRIAYDAYGIDGYSQVAYFEETRPFPGAGVAKYRVNRTIGQGRTLNLVVAVDYAAMPGMEVIASLPGTVDQTGYTSSVSWDFGADEMTVGTRGLIDTPASAWIKLPTGEAWDDSPAGQSWESEVV